MWLSQIELSAGDRQKSENCTLQLSSVAYVKNACGDSPLLCNSRRPVEDAMWPTHVVIESSDRVPENRVAMSNASRVEKTEFAKATSVGSFVKTLLHRCRDPIHGDANPYRL